MGSIPITSSIKLRRRRKSDEDWLRLIMELETDQDKIEKVMEGEKNGQRKIYQNKTAY